MKVIQQNVELLEQKDGKSGLHKHIETAARTCYQSLDKITDESADIMVNSLIKREHTAMLEHGTVYLFIPEKKYDAQLSLYSYAVKIMEDYGVVKFEEDGVYITTNYRVIIENKLNHVMKYMCAPTDKHEKRYTLRLTTNLQVATECLRHRKMSFAMESSRYCSYDKAKFGDELTFILPSWFDANTPQSEVIEWSNGCQDAENHYMRLRNKGWTPEKCAQFLPKSAKTTLVMTGFERDWKHFLDLRYFEKTGKVHPQMKELSTLVYRLIGDKVIKNDEYDTDKI